MKRYSDEYNQQYVEHEKFLDSFIRKNHLLRNCLLILLLTSIFSLSIDIKSNLDVDIHLFLWITCGSIILSGITILCLVFQQILKRKIPNIITKVIANIYIFLTIIYSSAICIGLITGAVIKHSYLNGFSLIAFADMAIIMIFTSLIVFMYKTTLPTGLYLEEAA
jgi:hypothetical protein